MYFACLGLSNVMYQSVLKKSWWYQYRVCSVPDRCYFQTLSFMFVWASKVSIYKCKIISVERVNAIACWTALKPAHRCLPTHRTLKRKPGRFTHASSAESVRLHVSVFGCISSSTESPINAMMIAYFFWRLMEKLWHNFSR